MTEPASPKPLSSITADSAGLQVLPKCQEREEREIDRIIDERMANPAPGIPIEGIAAVGKA
ncbi:hypothetical protein [Streptomyces sp.]|uniref:hypothetical protein n=1 Tax=Streptomyces sp. TaxID=1931 RepID=UPI002F91D281